jgi:D-methionine transport system ATP-binding protein
MTRIDPLAVLAGIDFGTMFHADPLLWRSDERLPPEPPPRRARGHGADVRIEHVGKAFPGGARVLDGVSLSVAAGSIFGIIGRSGAGKSTLLRCINRLETPDRGHIAVGGER